MNNILSKVVVNSGYLYETRDGSVVLNEKGGMEVA